MGEEDPGSREERVRELEIYRETVMSELRRREKALQAAEEQLRGTEARLAHFSTSRSIRQGDSFKTAAGESMKRVLRRELETKREEHRRTLEETERARRRLREVDEELAGLSGEQ
jgi:hypothetical protein